MREGSKGSKSPLRVFISSSLGAFVGLLIIILTVLAVLAVTSPFPLMSANRGFFQGILSAVAIGIVGFLTSWYNWLSTKQMMLGLLPLQALLLLAIPMFSELPLLDPFNLGWFLALNLLVSVPWLLGLVVSVGIRSGKESLLVSLIVFLFISNAEGAGLRLRFRDEQGQKIQLSKAELLLVSWGVADRLDLETQREHLAVPLE